MEDKPAELSDQARYEKVARSHAEEVIKHPKKEKYRWIPESVRRVTRFGFYSIWINMPKDSFNKQYTRAYLPIGMRHHLITIFSVYCLTKYTLKKIYPPRY